ncbi:hypothetical protein [Succinivibrio dextrinosolvens]|uniref:hypothetical protein n=1 Tax=Succinivibrio dextrinosolvens TaxID=83771 RepID=UPI002479650E|nr:hypothetical protein [Succinivibrio dextrinosolvens]
MARKKIVFVIVEGPSDSEALGGILNKLFSDSSVYVHIVHGDITTQDDTTSGNIIKKITALVKNYASSRHLTKIHFKKVIHIVDMDGAYVDDSYVRLNKSLSSVVYSYEGIETSNVQGIIDRNHLKKECLNVISSKESIWKDLPYQAYFMSCNLDHVLYNKLNLSDDEKEKLSLDFAKKYKDNLDLFRMFILDSSFSLHQMSYRDSWSFIKQSNRSLKRYTNFGLCILEANKSDS